MSQTYQNHSIRVTGATILAKNFNPHQIMAVTDHKSVQSLRVFERVSPQKKVNIGRTLTNAIVDEPSFDLDPDLDMLDFLNDLNHEQLVVSTAQRETAVGIPPVGLSHPVQGFIVIII